MEHPINKIDLDKIKDCSKFDGKLENWDTTNCTSLKNVDTIEKIKYCQDNNLEIFEMKILGGFVVFIKESEHPEFFKLSFNQDISAWDKSKVKKTQDRMLAELKPMKVYVLMCWFYEGDSNLVNTFQGVYKTKEEALNACKKGVKFVTKWMKLYPDTPEDWGQYESESKYEIRECEI